MYDYLFTKVSQRKLLQWLWFYHLGSRIMKQTWTLVKNCKNVTIEKVSYLLSFDWNHSKIEMQLKASPYKIVNNKFNNYKLINNHLSLKVFHDPVARTRFVRDAAQNEAFNKVKSIRTWSPWHILSYFDPSENIVLQIHVHVSKIGRGAILLQDGKPVLCIKNTDFQGSEFCSDWACDVCYCIWV